MPGTWAGTASSPRSWPPASDMTIGFDDPGASGERQPAGRTSSRFAARLRDLARLDMGDAEAEELWRNVARHRRALWNRLGRDVGARVALLDYIVNIRPTDLGEPQIITR